MRLTRNNQLQTQSEIRMREYSTLTSIRHSGICKSNSVFYRTVNCILFFDSNVATDTTKIDVSDDDRRSLQSYCRNFNLLRQILDAYFQNNRSVFIVLSVTSIIKVTKLVKTMIHQPDLASFELRQRFKTENE